MSVRRIMAALAACIFMAAGARAMPAPQQISDVKALVDLARASFDQLDYENTVKVLDSAIATIAARPTDEMRLLLLSAYEMRGRSQFGLGREPEARADFVSLLKVDSGYALTGQISPRILTLFDEVTKETVTDLQLAITPPDADVLLDGAKVPATGSIRIIVGSHTLIVSRLGYKPATLPISAAAGAATVVDTLSLERVASVLKFATAPPGVEVWIDGISRGVTKPGPVQAEYVEKAARAGIPAQELSAALIVTDVPIGPHRVEYRKECFVRADRPQTVDQLNDYVIDPVKLEPAVAALVVTSNQAGALVLVDGLQRGVAPITIGGVCEGDHLVELKSSSGRYFQRISASTGQRIPIDATLRPAFAIVSSSGSAALNADLRLTIERQLQSSQAVTVFAPAATDVARVLGSERLPADWLAFDLNKRPIGSAVDVAPAMRSDLSARLARQFESQGIAAVTVPSASARNQLVVALLASGSGVPDIFDVNLDIPESVNLAVGRLDRTLSFFRPSIGLSVVDVADVTGPVVVAVEPNGPAAKLGVQIGDVLLKANGQDVKDAMTLTTLLAGRKVDDVLSLELKDKAGALRRADVKVVMTPRLIGLDDQLLMINRLLVDLRARLLSPGDATTDAVIRLNLAVALSRVGAWAEARNELQRVKLPDGPGVSNGTVLYLLGLAAERLGNAAEAEASWRSAEATAALLTEDGPPVKELAAARLLELQRRGRLPLQHDAPEERHAPINR